jgi:hypothetical protein
MATTSKPVVEQILREFPAVGKYRVRILKRPRKGELTLDVREYVTGETFEGFTRRGIALTLDQVTCLKVALDEALEIMKAETPH